MQSKDKSTAMLQEGTVQQRLPKAEKLPFYMLRDRFFFLFFFLLNLLQTGLPKYCETPGHCNNQGVITQECL